MCTTRYKCFFCLYTQQEIQMLRLAISILWLQFFLHLCSKILSVILLNYKNSNWFFFLIDIRSPQTIKVFSRQNTELFREYIFRSSHPELFYKKVVLKDFAQFESYICRSLLCSRVAGWKPPTVLKRDPSTGVVLWILRNFQEHLFYETPVNGCFCILYLYQHEERFACTQIIAHSFDLLIAEL